MSHDNLPLGEIEYVLTRADWRRALLWRSRTIWAMYGLTPPLLVLLVFCMVPADPELMWLDCVGPMLMLCGFPPLMELVAWASPPGDMGPHRITLYDDALSEENEAGANRRFWHRIRRIVRTRAGVLIYTARDTALFVPSSAFRSEQAAIDFTQLASRLHEESRSSRST